MEEQQTHRLQNRERQSNEEPARDNAAFDPAIDAVRGGPAGARDQGEVRGVAGTGGSSGAGSTRANVEYTGQISGIEAPASGQDDESDESLRRILQDTQVIAVIGLTPDTSRPSHEVAGYLQQHGYRIVPVNPDAAPVLGETAYADIASIPFPVDVVDIFRRSEKVGPHVDEAIAGGARVVWMQLGIRNEEAAQRARAAGLKVVMDHCMKQEHRRLLERR